MSDLDADRRRCERWFVRRGLPHLIADYSVREDILTRATPLLVFVVFVELFLSFGDRYEGWGQAAAFIAGLAVLVGGFALVNRWRGRGRFQLPDEIGPPELLLYLLAPAVVAAIGADDDPLRNALVVIAVNIVLLAVIAALTAWGVVPMIGWSVGQLRRQIGDIVNVLAKSLPLLLLFSAFLFLNAEMWQVADDWTLPYFAIVIGLLTLAGASFVAISVRRLAVDLARFEAWADVRPRCDGTPVERLVPSDDDPPPDAPTMPERARVNVALLLFVAQGIQIALVATVVAAFYVVFGLLTVRETTVLQWTEAGELTRAEDWTSRLGLLGEELLFSRQLLLVAAFIGVISSLNYAVQVVTDETYRREFAADMTDEIRQTLAVRAVYHRRLVGPEI